MSVITYKDATALSIAAIEKVYLNGKLVGYVRQDTAGYYYEPLGSCKARGLSHESIRAVHRSLEC